MKGRGRREEGERDEGRFEGCRLFTVLRGLFTVLYCTAVCFVFSRGSSLVSSFPLHHPLSLSLSATLYAHFHDRRLPDCLYRIVASVPAPLSHPVLIPDRLDPATSHVPSTPSGSPWSPWQQPRVCSEICSVSTDRLSSPHAQPTTSEAVIRN